MPTPPRILRADIEDIAGARPRLTQREHDRRDAILTAGQRVLAIHGRVGVRLSDLATALGMAPSTLRRYFPDLDYLLGEILRRHLLAVSSAIGQALCGVPAEGRQPAARIAYVAATRTVLGGHTEAHLLLVRERHHLPPDQLEGIQAMRDGLGNLLAGELATQALNLLDMPDLSHAQIEAMLHVLVRPARGKPRLQLVSRAENPWSNGVSLEAGPPSSRSPQLQTGPP